MRKYNKKILVEAACNQCGKKLLVKNGILIEGMLEVKQNFGYFSNKDGQTHTFDLCEECYDRLVQDFAIPVSVKEEFAWQVDSF